MDDLTETQQNFVTAWFFGSPLVVVALLFLGVLLTRRRGERQWLRVALGLVVGGALPAVVVLTSLVGLLPSPAHSQPTVVDHLWVAGEEEVLKFAAAVLVCLPLARRGVVMTGVVGAAVATGFTITENARFFMTAPTFGVFEAIVVERTFVPVHVVLTCAVCLCAAAGWVSRGPRRALGALALGAATMIHAGLNLRLTLPASWLDTAVHASVVTAALGLMAAGGIHRRRSRNELPR